MNTHRAIQQRDCSIKDNPYQRSGVMANGSKVCSDAADAEPVPEKDYGYEQESIELRIRSYELLNACVRASTAHANVAEYYPQDYRNGREPVDIVPGRTVRAIFSGGVVNWLNYCLDGDYRRNDDKHNAYNSLESFHDFLLCPE